MRLLSECVVAFVRLAVRLLMFGMAPPYLEVNTEPVHVLLLMAEETSGKAVSVVQTCDVLLKRMLSISQRPEPPPF